MDPATKDFTSLPGSLVVFVLAAASSLSCLSACAPVDPAPYDPPVPPALEGPLEPNERLLDAVRIAEGDVDGPEDVEVDEQGRIYAGTADGRIVRIDPETEDVETFADTGGRPLGMMFDADGNLIVCDSYRGLLSIDDTGRIEVLADEADSTPFRFTNELDIAADGTIYFSDASSRFEQTEHRFDMLEARPHGRLIRYEPDTGEVEVLLSDLYFANGVALSEDESFVVVNETYRYRMQRYWLDGPHRGTVEVFADNLPGFPDNLNRSSEGTFWLALVAVRNSTVDGIHPSPFKKSMLARLPGFLWPSAEPHGYVVELDEDGRILRTLQDPEGDVIANVTSVKERDGALYFGTLDHDWVGRYSLR